MLLVVMVVVVLRVESVRLALLFAHLSEADRRRERPEMVVVIEHGCAPASVARNGKAAAVGSSSGSSIIVDAGCLFELEFAHAIECRNDLLGR